jgi:hypothetical protein
MFEDSFELDEKLWSLPKKRRVSEIDRQDDLMCGEIINEPIDYSSIIMPRKPKENILDNLDFTHDPDIDNESTKIVNLTGIIKINKIKLQK